MSQGSVSAGRPWESQLTYFREPEEQQNIAKVGSQRHPAARRPGRREPPSSAWAPRLEHEADCHSGSGDLADNWEADLWPVVQSELTAMVSRVHG